MATHRVLFVDDEPRVLDAMRLRLRRQRNAWEVLCADGGKAALEVLARHPIDVVVSDMRMPGMDGATLLGLIKERYPHVVRIALSGQTDAETSLRAVPVAHQFLTKPCEPGVIEGIVERTCRLQRLVHADVVTRTVGRITSLPPLPRIYAQLTGALNRGTAPAAVIAEILEQDPAMCAKTLQLVNSAFFRMSRRITRVDQAVTYLGYNTIKHMALAAEVFQHAATGTLPISTSALQLHALRVAHVAKAIGAEVGCDEEAFIVGLLHDIGKLLVASELPTLMVEVLRVVERDAVRMHEAEQALLGTTHAEIGAYLLGLWGLPFPVVEAVANHHAPNRVGTFDLVGAVHVADALVSEYESASPDTVRAEDILDCAFLGAVGVEQHVPRWRGITAKTLTDLSEAETAEGAADASDESHSRAARTA